MLDRGCQIARGTLRRTAGALFLWALLIACWAQHFPLGQFRDFSLPEYYDVPHETQMKSLLQGQQAMPQGEGRILIKKLKLETFREDGVAEFILQADDCLYDTEHRTAASPGPLEMKTADGRFSTEGEGFLWREHESVLIISNRVHTMIRGVQAEPSNP